MPLLDGKCALVTGGGSGIGLATVRRMAAEGARVAVLDRVEEAASAAAADIAGLPLVADVTDSAQVASAFEEAKRFFGRLDIAYLNAGVTTGETEIDKLTDEQYRRIVGVNVDGVVFGAREAARLLEPGGNIVATASLAGLLGFDRDPIYTLTKHAVVGIVRALAPQLAVKGIRINCVCPGITETPLVGDEAAAVLRQAGFPLIRPEEIAEAVMRILADERTGEAWFVQPGREPEPFRFRNVPGPRTPGAEGMKPPVYRE